jgi:hypothetical protein
MQIRMQLDQAGLDPAAVDAFSAVVNDLKALMSAPEAPDPNDPQAPATAKSGKAGKISKAGKLAISVWDRLLTTMRLMYQFCVQHPGPDSASDFRLVVRKWIEKVPARGNRRGLIETNWLGVVSLQRMLCI